MQVLDWDQYNADKLVMMWDYFRMSDPRMNTIFGSPCKELIERNNLLNLTEFITNNKALYNQLLRYFELIISSPSEFYLLFIANIVREQSIIIQRHGQHITIGQFDISDNVTDYLFKKGIYDKVVLVLTGQGFLNDEIRDEMIEFQQNS